MPSISEAQKPAPENYAPIDKPAPPPMQSGGQPSLTPGQNPNMRCPVPQISQFTADANTQFYRGSIIPQFRNFTPPSLTAGNSGSGGITNQTINEETTTNVVNTITTQLTFKSASLTTATLASGAVFQTGVTLVEAYNVVAISTSAAARVRIYSLAHTQAIDAARAITTAPPAEVTQGLVADINLVTAPFVWTMSPPALGCSIGSTLAYVTITNNNLSATSITLAVSYIPLVS